MRVSGRVSAVAMAACLIFVASPRATADERNQETVVTFSRDVEIPGKVLPAGTYVFRLADTQSNSHKVLVLDRAGRFRAVALTVAATRVNATADTQITFEERPAGTPFLLKQWFYPGRLTGEEFVYPLRAENRCLVRRHERSDRYGDAP